ncbi:hypothetical protein HF072_04190 [Bacillus sp. RO3]|nr:hypothetical protein [Bacillus sp. RO3]
MVDFLYALSNSEFAGWGGRPPVLYLLLAASKKLQVARTMVPIYKHNQMSIVTNLTFMLAANRLLHNMYQVFKMSSLRIKDSLYF